MKMPFVSKDKIKELRSSFRECIVVDRLNAVEWIFLCIILVFILVTLFYDDNAGMY